MRLTGRVASYNGKNYVFHPFLEEVPPQGPVDAPVDAWVELNERGESRVLALPGTARAGFFELAARHGLNPSFSPAVWEQTAAFSTNPGWDDTNLEDLRHLPFCTIDELTSRDLDQALFVERREGGFAVWYAIADAAHFVPPCTPLFRRALEQGASYYLPGLVLPMLPKPLSEDLVSLNPSVTRRAMVFEMELDAAGECLRTRLHRAAVLSRAKLYFEGVQRWYDGGSAPVEDPAVLDSLAALAEVGEIRVQRELREHLVRYRRTEMEVSLGGLGLVGQSDLRNPVERYNEQVSLLANAEGAKVLLTSSRPGLEPVYRVHEAPPPVRLAALRETIRALVQLHKVDPAVWAWSEATPLADYLRRLPETGPWSGLARAIQRHALLTNQRSTFQATPGEHYGVGAPFYSRFTAPMREVVGIYVHEETWDAVGLAASRSPEGLRAQVMDAGNRSRELQKRLDREANRMVLDQLLLHGQGPFRGTLMGLTRTKLHVTLHTPPVDVKLYRFDLENFWGRALVIGQDEVSIRDRRENGVLYRVGDEVEVFALGRDEQRDRWKLVVRPPT